MNWDNLTVFELTRDWQYTDPLSTALVKVTTVVPSSVLRGQYALGTVANGVFYPFDTRLLTGRSDYSLIAMPDWMSYPEVRLGFRRTDSSGQPWTISIDVLQPTLGSYPHFDSYSPPQFRRNGDLLQAGDRWLSSADSRWYQWNSTTGNWESEQLFVMLVSATGVALPFVRGLSLSYNLYINRWQMAGRTGNTNSSTSHWSLQLQRLMSGGSTVNLGTISTQALAANTDFSQAQNLDVRNLSTSSLLYFQVAQTATGSPSALTKLGGLVEYRLIPAWS